MTNQPTSNITFHESGYEPGKEVIRIDDAGFHYRGQFIADAGEAHRLMVEYLRQQTQPEPQGPTDDERHADFAAWLAREMPAGTVISNPLWWAPRIARAVLARWGRPAIEPQGPTDEELEATAKDAEILSMKKQGGLTSPTPDGIHAQLQEQRLAGLRAVAARWGRQ